VSRVQEIEAAIDRLSLEEFRSIARWLREREQQRWDEQLDSDSAAGRLDFLFEEAEAESQKGPLREWPAEK
jgi:hypothetical protein